MKHACCFDRASLVWVALLRLLTAGFDAVDGSSTRHVSVMDMISACRSENDKGVAIFDYALDNRPSTGRGNGRPAVFPTR
jgi:hypothetical protein